MVLKTRDFMYCFEFKTNASADEALAQIDTKEYAVPFKKDNRKLFKIGVRFDSTKNNIREWTATCNDSVVAERRENSL